MHYKSIGRSKWYSLQVLFPSSFVYELLIFELAETEGKSVAWGGPKPYPFDTQQFWLWCRDTACFSSAKVLLGSIPSSKVGSEPEPKAVLLFRSLPRVHMELPLFSQSFKQKVLLPWIPKYLQECHQKNCNYSIISALHKTKTKSSYLIMWSCCFQLSCRKSLHPYTVCEFTAQFQYCKYSTIYW